MPAPRPRARRYVLGTLKWAGIVTGLLVLTVALVVLVAATWLQTSGGQTFLRDQLLKQADNAIAGQLAVDRVKISGLLRVELVGVRLLAPGDPRPVATIDRVVLDIHLSALLARRVDVRELLVEHPQLHVLHTGDTTTLAQALAPKHPSPPSVGPPSKPPPLVLRLPTMQIKDGAVDSDGEQPFAVTGLNLNGSAEGALSDLALSLSVHAHLREPAVRDAALEVRGRYGDTVTVDLFSLRFGDSKLSLTGFAKQDASKATLQLQELFLAAKDVNAFVPDAALLENVGLVGSAALDGRAATLNLDLTPGSGRVTLDASAKLGATAWTDLFEYQAAVEVRDVEPQRLREGFPVALLKARVTANGVGVPLRGKAKVTVDAGGSRYQHLPIDEVHLVASITGREAHISELLVQAAQVDLTAKGTASETEANLDLTIAALSLAKTRAALISGLAVKLQPVQGSARISAHLEGPYANPKAQVTVSAPEIITGDNRVQALQFFANLSRLRPSPIGSFNASAVLVRVGGHTSEKIWIGGSVDGHRADVDAKGEFSGKPVQLLIRGERLTGESPIEQWSFSRFEGRALGLSMSSERPMQLAYGRGGISVKDVRLRGDLGRLELDAELSGKGTIAGRLRLDSVHLEKVPPALLPEDLKLAGALTLNVDLKGTQKHPQVDATIAFQNGRFRNLVGLTLNGHLHLLHDRLSGALAGTVATGRFDLTINAPVMSLADAFERGAPAAPVSITLTTTHLPLHDLALLATEPVEMSGDLTARIVVKGTLQSPIIDIDSQLDDLAVATAKNVFANLTASYAKEVWLADLKVTHSDTLDAKVAGRLALPTEDLLLGRELHVPKRALTAAVSLTHLDLAWLNLLGYGPPDLKGSLAGRVALSGSLGAPRLSGTVKGTGVAASGYRNLDATLDLDTAEQVALNAEVRMSGQLLAQLNGVVGDSLAHLIEAEDLLQIPVTVKAVLAKTDLDLLLPEAAPIQGEAASPFRASIEGMLDVSGTLNAPKALVHVAVVEQQRSGGRSGTLTTDLAYADARTTLKVLFHSEEAGDLRIAGELQSDLGAKALHATGQKALSTYTGPAEELPSVWSAGIATALSTPTTITLDADQFDLALANGFTNEARNLGGRLDLHLRKTGPLIPLASDGSLKAGNMLTGLTGTLALTKGQATMLGRGTFSEVSMKASGDYPSLTVDELKGKAGNGTFELTAKLQKTTGSEFDGKLALTLNAFPIVENFQTRGFISMKLDAAGHGDATHISIPLVTIRQGHVQIPNLPRKVQSLEAHPDIELANEKVPIRVTTSSRLTVQVDRIEIPNDFVIDAPLDNRLTIGAELAMLYDPAFIESDDTPIELTGKINIVRGDIVILKKFEVDSGEITFFKHALQDPNVRLKAHYDGPDAKIMLSVNDSVQQLIARADTKDSNNLKGLFTSNPPMEMSEILYYLTTGQRQTRPQQSDTANLQTQFADAAISALGASAIGAVQDLVQRVLPKEINPDVLSVEADVQHAGIGRVRAGKYYFDGKLYVGGRYTPSANPLLNENTYEGEAEYRLGGNQYLRLLVGNEGHHQLYYLIERSFPTAKQRKNGVR